MSRTVSSSLCAIVTIHSSQRNLSLFCPHRLAEMMSRSSTPSFSYEEKELKLLKSAIQFFFRHIRFDESTVSRMSDNPVFQLFDEYEQLLLFTLDILGAGIITPKSLIRS